MATTAQNTKRQASSAKVDSVAKPQCKIHASAVLADKAQLIGPHLIEVGENSFIHPYAKINAEHGNVFIGRGCLLSEKSVVGPSAHDGEKGCILGVGVSIESGAVVEARRIGDYSTIEVGAKLHSGCVIGKWCKVSAMCEVAEGEVLEDFTVVFADGMRRVNRTLREHAGVRDVKVNAREQEFRLLKALIPDGKIKWTG